MSRTNKGNNPANPHQQNIKRSIMSRVRVLYAVFAVIAVAIFAMILVTQYGPNGTPLRNRSDLKCYKTIEVPASRGNIYSHDGRILATDSPSYNLSLDFTVLDMSDEEFGASAPHWPTASAGPFPAIRKTISCGGCAKSVRKPCAAALAAKTSVWYATR